VAEIRDIPGLNELWADTHGDPRIRVAVLDGNVDADHPCFAGAHLEQPRLPWAEPDTEVGRMAMHGTMVASILFGQHGSDVRGVAPECTGILIPIYSKETTRTTQLELSRAIEFAVEQGAHVINISGGQLTDSPDADDWLERAIQLCRDRNVLVVAAAGNDGCECLHVPAALDSVLAVGALDAIGEPLEMSNWGEAYQAQGVIAPGEDIHGAVPDGETARASGTSLATPIVSGVAALLLSKQLDNDETPDPHGVRAAILGGVSPCDPSQRDDCSRFLVGTLNVEGAVKAMPDEKNTVPEPGTERAVVSACDCDGPSTPAPITEDDTMARAAAMAGPLAAAHPVAAPAQVAPQSAAVEPQADVEPQGDIEPQTEGGGGLVYALGTLGYDFGTEARRDSFKQLMPPAKAGNTLVPANPHDARQMVDYLSNSPSEARSLIWTINMELTPLYAVEAVGPYAHDVYSVLLHFLGGQVAAESAADYVDRVSVPGHLAGRTVRLFSGQIVPVIEAPNTRGLYGWHVNQLVDAAAGVVTDLHEDADKGKLHRSLRGFLQRVYYDLRNLGTTSHDRALNFAATNAFQAAHTFAEAVAEGMELDTIEVEKSPFGRMDSDCWDVKLKFFDPENTRRARKVFRATIDVSDVMPVSIGEVRSWSTSK